MRNKIGEMKLSNPNNMRQQNCTFSIQTGEMIHLTGTDKIKSWTNCQNESQAGSIIRPSGGKKKKVSFDLFPFIDRSKVMVRVSSSSSSTNPLELVGMWWALLLSRTDIYQVWTFTEVTQRKAQSHLSYLSDPFSLPPGVEFDIYAYKMEHPLLERETSKAKWF